MKKGVVLGMMVFVLAVVVAGCAGGKVSADKPIDQVVAEAKTMAVAELQSIIKSYQDVIESKQGEIAKLQAKIKEIPLTQIMGEEAKALKADISAIVSTVNGLTERMNVYLKELKAQGGSL